MVKGPAFTDASGWNKPEYYSTLQLGDINGDGKADFCGRGKNGIACYLSTGSAFSATAITGPALTDANHWDNPAYFDSITLVGGMAHALTGGVDAGIIEDDGNDPPVFGAPPGEGEDGGIPFPQSVNAGCAAAPGGTGLAGALVLAAVLAVALTRRR